MTSWAFYGCVEITTWKVLGTTATNLLNLNVSESHFLTMFLGRKLSCVEFSGLVPMHYFEVICWPSWRRTWWNEAQALRRIFFALLPVLFLFFTLVRWPWATVTHGFLGTGSCREIVLVILIPDLLNSVEVVFFLNLATTLSCLRRAY